MHREIPAKNVVGATLDTVCSKIDDACGRKEDEIYFNPPEPYSLVWVQDH